MKRKIVKIDEGKCNGCGDCIPSCHEGAIRIIGGKARLAADALCDGLGACLGECPTGAISLEEREAEDFVVPEPVHHGALPCGCPGSMTQDFRQDEAYAPKEKNAPTGSALRQWPVQLKLLNPLASFFKDADLLVSADCAAFAYGDFHQEFLQGKVLVIFCPKLDEDAQAYVVKLGDVFRLNHIKSVTVVRMEVPCCGGTVSIVKEALKRSGKELPIKEYTVSLKGNIVS
ncbi:MAG: 4Fe-4S dicluster domain-containing protein [Candidatus Omnitrophota bacterium]